MATLLLRLVGPMQSWGTTSRFDERDTGKEPSKSGVIGLVAAALGIDRENWDDLAPITYLAMGVRHDRPGVPKRDYQTAGASSDDSIVRANGTQSAEGVVSNRHYLADAAFLVGLSGDDRALLTRIHAALANPVWTLGLGRKSYVPSEPIWMENAIVDAPLRTALAQWPSIIPSNHRDSLPARLMMSVESSNGDGLMKMDQPLSSFAQRRFGPRFVLSEMVDVPCQAHS